MIDFNQLIRETSAVLVSLSDGEKVKEHDTPNELLAAITGIAALDKATPSDLAFIINARYRDDLFASKAGVVIMSEGFAKGYSGLALLHNNPYWVYARAACLFQEAHAKSPADDLGEQERISRDAVISRTAELGENVSVAAGAVIEEGAKLGDNCSLAANSVVAAGAVLGSGVKLGVGAKVLNGCILGDDVMLDAGAVVGSEGFGFAPYHHQDQLYWQRIAQLGIVRVGNRVYIGANTTIDRGAIDDTVVGDDVIIDNQVQIAHNCIIGRGTAIAGCVGMAGSSIIGERCSIGGGAGIAGHLSVADDTVVLGMTLINKSVKEKGVYASGTGMQSAEQWRKSAVRFTQLEKLNQRVRALEAKNDKG